VVRRPPLPPGPPEGDRRRLPWLQRLLRWLKADLPEGFPGFEDEPGETTLPAGAAWAEAAETPRGRDDRPAPRPPQGGWPPASREAHPQAGGTAVRPQPSALGRAPAAGPGGDASPNRLAPAAPPPPGGVPPRRRGGARNRKQRHAREGRGAWRILGVAVAALTALAVVMVAAAGVRLAFGPSAGHRVGTSRPHTPATHASPQSATSPAASVPTGATEPASTPATGAAVPAGQPDCAAMRMLRAPAAGAQPVPGLCDDLGNGTSWLVGCAPGFQRTCDPALQAVILCLRAEGARHGGMVTAADVTACARSAAGRVPDVRAGHP
jgi:hypothetical protein